MAPLPEESITPQEWQGVKELIDELEQDAQCELFVKSLFQWDLAVKYFRKVELRRIILGEPKEEDLRFHAMCLNALMAVGNALLLKAKTLKDGYLASINITYSQIDAYVEELSQSYREWHHGFTKKEVGDLKARIFGGAA